MFMLRSTHEREMQKLQNLLDRRTANLISYINTAGKLSASERGAQKGLLRLQRRYKKLKSHITGLGILNVGALQEENRKLKKQLEDLLEHPAFNIQSEGFAVMDSSHAPLDK